MRAQIDRFGMYHPEPGVHFRPIHAVTLADLPYAPWIAQFKAVTMSAELLTNSEETCELFAVTHDARAWYVRNRGSNWLLRVGGPDSRAEAVLFADALNEQARAYYSKRLAAPSTAVAAVVPAHATV